MILWRVQTLADLYLIDVANPERGNDANVLGENALYKNTGGGSGPDIWIKIEESVLGDEISTNNLDDAFLAWVLAVGLRTRGYALSANGANLSVDIAAGNRFTAVGDAPDGPQSPIATFLRTRRDGGGGFTKTSSSTIDPDFWDDGTGTLNTVQNNNWQIQPVHIRTDGSIEIGYGQAEYDMLDEARAAINDFVVQDPDQIQDGNLIGVVLVQEGTTDLNNAEFVPIYE